MKIVVALFLFFVNVCSWAGETEAPACSQLSALPTNKSGLQQFRGKVVYVDFWASWCPPCLKSFPFMNELQRQFAQQGFKVVAINLDEQREDADNFTSQVPHEFSIAFDNNERDCANAFQVKAMPSSYLIDRQGRIRFAHMGFKTDETEVVRQQIEQLLAEPSDVASTTN